MVLLVKCGKQIHAKYVGLRRATVCFSTNFVHRLYEGQIGESVEQEESCGGEVNTVREFTYLDARVGESG